jgi:hypothetical protein
LVSRIAIVGDGHDCYQEDVLSVVRSKAGALSEKPRMDFLGLRKVAKKLVTKTQRGVEHFSWGVSEVGAVWENSSAFNEGLHDIAWPLQVWNCRKYRKSDENDDDDEDEAGAFDTVECSDDVVSASA